MPVRPPTQSHNPPANRPFSTRLPILLGVLCVAMVIFVVFKWRTSTRPAPPPPSASTSEKIRFYQQQIKSDPGNYRAYIELGKLEERREFYTSALRRLYAARALGAPEREIALPIGRSLSGLARWSSARSELEKALALNPDDVEAVANLAGVFFKSGDSPSASRVLSEFADRHRNADRSLRLSLDQIHRLMFCFEEAGNTEKAGEMAQEVIRLDAKDAGAYSLAGHAFLIAERYHDALPYFERAMALEPATAELYYNYGDALQHCGRTAEALRALQRCVSLNPNATDAFVILANIYESQKNWKLAALAISNAAVHFRTNYIFLYRAGTINRKAGNIDDANYWFSNAAISAGQYSDGLKYSRQLAASKNPKWSEAGMRNLAAVYRAQHKMREYIATMQQITRGNTGPDLMQMAEAYENADLLDKQVECLRRALALDTTGAGQIHYLIGQTLLKRGLRDQAEQELEAAVASEPGNSDYWSDLGAVYLQRRTLGDRAAKAIAAYQKVVRLAPKDASSFQNLGIAYVAAGDYGHAAPNLEHAIDLQPGYGPAYQELGRVYAKIGDREASEKMLALYREYVLYDLKLKTLQAKADQNKKDPNAQVELADMLTKNGDLTGALDRYQAALQLRPGDSGIQRKYDRVLESITHTKVKPTAGRRAASGGS